MNDAEIEVQRLCGELEMLCRERDWWAEEMLFWRTKYLLDHPENKFPTYVKTAREDEKIDVMIFMDPEDLK